MDRWTDGQMDRGTDAHMHICTETVRATDRDRQRQTETDRDRQRHTETNRDRQTDRWTDGQLDGRDGRAGRRTDGSISRGAVPGKLPHSTRCRVVFRRGSCGLGRFNWAVYLAV